ncbi:MAG: ParA family protein [Kineosporiaceae bacterium]
MTVVALFNNKGGVGMTTLAYHLAHMVSRLGRRVLAVDLDPQANLTGHFLTDEQLEPLWNGDDETVATVADAVRPITEGLGDVVPPAPLEVADELYLLPGDLALSTFEEKLAQQWSATLAGGDNAAARATTAFHRLVRRAADDVGAQLVLVDVGPNLGALNRSALLIADHVIVPLGADLFSAQGLRNLGPSLARWRHDWQRTARPRIPESIAAPEGRMHPLGYVVMQPSMRLDRPVKAYRIWLDRIPDVYAEALGHAGDDEGWSAEIGTVRNYRSLMPLAHDARKPMFDLRPADGAIGSTQRYVQVCLQEFRDLSREVLSRLDADTADTRSPVHE